MSNLGATAEEGLTPALLGGKCLTRCVVYVATVTETLSGKKETYTGFTSRTFKRRLYELNADMSTSLNKRSEIFNTCRHWSQKLLENVKT